VLNHLDVGRFGSTYTILNANNGAIIVNTTNQLSDFYTLWNQTWHESRMFRFSSLNHFPYPRATFTRRHLLRFSLPPATADSLILICLFPSFIFLTFCRPHRPGGLQHSKHPHGNEKSFTRFDGT
jgi:hypothetical protein